MAASPNGSAIRAMKMGKRKKGCALPGTHGTLEKDLAAGKGSEAPLDVLMKAQEFFQICDVKGRGFITRHDMQVTHPCAVFHQEFCVL